MSISPVVLLAAIAILATIALFGHWSSNTLTQRWFVALDRLRAGEHAINGLSQALTQERSTGSPMDHDNLIAQIENIDRAIRHVPSNLDIAVNPFTSAGNKYEWLIPWHHTLQSRLEFMLTSLETSQHQNSHSFIADEIVAELNALKLELQQGIDRLLGQTPRSRSALKYTQYGALLAIIVLLIPLLTGFRRIAQRPIHKPPGNSTHDEVSSSIRTNCERPHCIGDAASSRTLHILRCFLSNLVDKSDSVEPFMVLLKEIQLGTGATDGAIFVSQGSEDSVTPLVSTSESDLQHFSTLLKDSWSDIRTRGRNIQPLGPPGKDGSQLVAIQLYDNVDANQGILLLAMPNQILSQQESLLNNLGEGLAAILCTTQAARANKRRALYEERAVIARELHDSLAQSLSYLKIQVARIQALLKSNRPSQPVDYSDIDTVVQELRVNLNLAYQRLRELITAFRLTMDGRTLVQALEDSVVEFENRSGIAFHLDNRVSNEDLTIDEEMQVLQIVREALSNVVQHSHAKRAEIALHIDPRGPVRLSIDDDGIGTNKLKKRDQHHGLVIMQQRAHCINGEFRVMPSLFGGTCIEVTFTTKNNDQTHIGGGMVQ